MLGWSGNGKWIVQRRIHYVGFCAHGVGFIEAEVVLVLNKTIHGNKCETFTQMRSTNYVAVTSVAVVLCWLPIRLAKTLICVIH